MPDAAEISMVATYALGSNQRLNAALATYDAYDEIRRLVFKKFVSELKDQIICQLNKKDAEWKVDVLPDVADWPGNRDCKLRVRHQKWHNGQFVGVGADRYGPNVLWFGEWPITD